MLKQCGTIARRPRTIAGEAIRDLRRPLLFFANGGGLISRLDFCTFSRSDWPALIAALGPVSFPVPQTGNSF